MLVKYLPYYTEEERHRHDVRPGLTGLAQVSGRNTISWKEKFDKDIEYVNNISFFNDCSVIIKTVIAVFKHDGVKLQAIPDLDKERCKEKVDEKCLIRQ